MHDRSGGPHDRASADAPARSGAAEGMLLAGWGGSRHEFGRKDLKDFGIGCSGAAVFPQLLNSPLLPHHDHQIPQAQFEARVPAHAQNDDLSVEVPSFEKIFDRGEPLHLFIIARHPRVCTRALEPSTLAKPVALLVR